MKRLIQHTKVSGQLVREGRAGLVPYPPVEWTGRGPRGGLYAATGHRTRDIVELDDDFIFDRMAVIDRSEGARYIRPPKRTR